MKKEDSPASMEKQALEKATGQNPQPESKLDSKPDIQQLDRQIEVAELIRLSMKNAEQITLVKSELDGFYQQEADYVKRLSDLKRVLKPVSRSRKKLHTTKTSDSVPPRDKKVKRAERDDIDHQLFLVREEIALKESELSSLTGKSSAYSKEKKLRSKANGRNYVKRNKHLIKSKMLKALNTFYKTSDPVTISRIRSLARSNAPNALKNFKWEFGNILEAIDVETFIMCSGLLSDELYSAARLTILSRSAAFRGTFEELIMPEK